MEDHLREEANLDSNSIHISVSVSLSSITGFERLGLVVWDKVPWSLKVNGGMFLGPSLALHHSGDGRDRHSLPQGQTAEAYRRRSSADGERGEGS